MSNCVLVLRGCRDRVGDDSMSNPEVAEAKSQAPGAPATLDELAEFELDDVKAGVEEAGG